MPCPCCGEGEAGISVRLDSLDGADALFCHSCDETFPLSFVRTVIRRWTKVLNWIDTAPQFTGDE